MSAANAAARKRRAGIDTPIVPAQARPQQSAGLTLPQVIALVDSRLITLETFMKETKETSIKSQVNNAPVAAAAAPAAKEALDSMADEFNERFTMLATEIADLKDIVIKLQSYTMEVNKVLMEERMNVITHADEEDDAPTFEISEFDTTN